MGPESSGSMPLYLVEDLGVGLRGIGGGGIQRFWGRSSYVFDLLSCLHDSGRELPLGIRGGDCRRGGLGPESDEEDGVEDKDTFMARQVQIFEADEAEREAVEWLAANPTRYNPEDSGSSVDVDCTVDLFELANRT